jgi:CHAT domain-containing protein/tetratricopeptide (TPR) repeat protein
MLAALLLLALQDSSAAPPRPFDRVVPLEIVPSDPVLEGHGPSKRVEHTIEFSGTLHVWTKGAGKLDTFLRVEDESGKLLDEDDDSGGKPTPYVKLEVEPGMKLVIAVAASKPGGTGKVELHLLAAPETDATRAEAKRAKQELIEVKKLLKAKNLTAARPRAEALVEHLVGVEGGTESELVADQAWLTGWVTRSLTLLHSTEGAWRLTLSHCTRTLPDDHPDLQSARINLAGTIKPLGDLLGARSLEQKVLEVYFRTLPEDHQDVQLARMNLGTSLLALGDFQGARDLEERALQIESKTLGEDDPNLQGTRVNLAITLCSLGDPKSARELLEKVRDVLERTRPDDDLELQIVRLDLAGMIDLLGDPQTALLLKEKVLAIDLKNLPDDHPNLQLARQNLATTIEALGDLERARPLYEKVLEVRKRTLPDGHPDLQLARCNCATALAQRERARSRGEREKDGDKSKVKVTGFVASFLHGMRKVKFTGFVASFLHGMRGAALQAVLGSSGREAEERAASGHALDLPLSLARGYGVFGEDEALEEQALLLSESTRNVALFSARLARAARSDPDWEKTRERISEATSRLAALGQNGGKSEEFAATSAELDRSQRELVKLGSHLGGSAIAALDTDFAALSSHLGEREALVGYRSYNCWAYGAAGPETVTPSLCAFVVRSGGKLTRVELGPIEPIEKAVEAWRNAVGVRLERGAAVPLDTQSPLIARGTDLRRLVFDPLREALSGAVRVVVALDDELHLVPLEALPAGEVWGGPSSGVKAEHTPTADSTLLGEKLQIEVALNLLLHQQTASEKPTSPTGILLAVGFPDCDHEPVGPDEPDEADKLAAATPSRTPEHSGILRKGAWDRGFPPLPGTRSEVEGIQVHYDEEFGEKDRAIVLERRRASREGLVSLAPRARFLHVAAHGWFAPESILSSEDPQPIDVKMNFGVRMGLGEQVRGMSPMLLCGLALAGANLPEDELGRIPGLITAEEVSALDLSSCELAVLSACDTNGGVRRAGQGVASLQKALHMAGARSVITSVWEVPDEATKTLMLDFYRRLWVEKKPKWQALWGAKMKIRNAKDEAGRPKYSTHDWAAWVLTGDPN